MLNRLANCPNRRSSVQSRVAGVSNADANRVQSIAPHPWTRNREQFGEITDGVIAVAIQAAQLLLCLAESFGCLPRSLPLARYRQTPIDPESIR